jgi:hypothetical protein
MLTAEKLLLQFPELEELFRRGRGLSFPIASSGELGEQLAKTGEQIVFRGVCYDTRSGAELMPEFFFPLVSLEDLTVKAAELILSRGLLPFPDQDLQHGGTS